MMNNGQGSILFSFFEETDGHHLIHGFFWHFFFKLYLMLHFVTV